MNIPRSHPVNEFLAKLIFLVLPTVAISYFVLCRVSEYFSVVGAIPGYKLFNVINLSVSQPILVTGYVAAGMGLSALFHSFRFRFAVPFALLCFTFYFTYKGLDNSATGEFDAFFISVQFLVFSIFFLSGWLCGWGFMRLRYWSIAIAAFMLCACIALIAKQKADTVFLFLRAFTPALLYAVYIIFTAEQIYGYKDKSQKFWWFLSRRLAFFCILASLLLAGIYYIMQGQIKEVVANYGGSGKDGKNSMLDKNKKNEFNLKDHSRLSPSLSRDNNLLFCAHIDNYFEGTNNPNPLYLTAFYFTKFDTATETFERDSVIPYNDLFEPDPTAIPMFSTRSDSMVIKNSLGDKFRKIVEIEVYTKDLAPNTYLAPNVGFFVQPITIEKDFRDVFKTAYRAKSYVSELNSAYFVYNIDTPVLRKFQEQRFQIMRQCADYSSVDPKFMKYYTQMPGDNKFKTIGDLAHKITDTAHTPVDKVIAIRNYFLSRDENGKRLYQYTDNPGVPDIPNASKLLYFLNENHKGYCAYFAGATLFMLRSLGIPSRIAVGFLTEDRSDKNKGWYWYYANQAHAWVQVYFPGLGWMDFDTTVGNDAENRPTPQPDGTPPMQPPKAWLAAEGVVIDVDTLKKVMHMSIRQMVLHDKEYKMPTPIEMEMDMHIATVFKDSMAIPLSLVKKGDSGTAVSYAEAIKNMVVTSGENAYLKIPSPTPIDEVYLKRKDSVIAKKQPPVTTQPKQVSVTQIAWAVLMSLVILLLLLLLMPELTLWYFILRHNNAKAVPDKAYWAYTTATYLLHQCGIFRGNSTPMQFANQVVDPRFGTSFTQFMNAYLKNKYAKQALNPAETQTVTKFLRPFMTAVKKHVPFKTRLIGFINPLRCAAFFILPDADEREG